MAEDMATDLLQARYEEEKQALARRFQISNDLPDDEFFYQIEVAIENDLKEKKASGKAFIPHCSIEDIPLPD